MVKSAGILDCYIGREDLGKFEDFKKCFGTAAPSQVAGARNRMGRVLRGGASEGGEGSLDNPRGDFSTG